MPSSPNYKRDYQQENKYKGKPDQLKKRASRNAARAKLKKAGVDVRGKDVAHKDGNPMNNSRSNLKAVDPKKNRSYKRTKSAGKKNPRS